MISQITLTFISPTFSITHSLAHSLTDSHILSFYRYKIDNRPRIESLNSLMSIVICHATLTLITLTVSLPHTLTNTFSLSHIFSLTHTHIYLFTILLKVKNRITKHHNKYCNNSSGSYFNLTHLHAQSFFYSPSHSLTHSLTH